MTFEATDHRQSAAPSPPEASNTRRRAEEKIAAMRGTDLDTMLTDKSGSLLHELRVHQVELEMQNDELRQAQVALEAARARYFDLYEMAPVGYITFSEQNMILEANLRAAALLGVDRSELARQAITRFIDPEDQAAFYLHRKKLFETGEAQSYELRMKRPDGGKFWVRLDSTVARDEHTRVEETNASVCRVTLSDITELKRVEQMLQQKNIELEEAIRTRS